MKLIDNGLVAAGVLVIGLTIGVPTGAAAAQGDKAFLEEAASGGKMEVELGRHASRNAGDPQVKKFGERMVADHGKANAELARIAERESVTLPKELTGRHDATVRKLTTLKGADFDRAYIKAMVEDHEEDVAKFREVARSAETPQVKAFAQKTLPTLEEHLKMAKAIEARLETHAAVESGRR